MLGYDILPRTYSVGRGIAIDPVQVEAVRDRPVPKSVAEVQSFLGLAGLLQEIC